MRHERTYTKSCKLRYNAINVEYNIGFESALVLFKYKIMYPEFIMYSSIFCFAVCNMYISRAESKDSQTNYK